MTATLWVVVLVGGAAYAASLAVPLWFQVHEQRLLIVTSGSMAPMFEAGDAVVLRRITDPSQLKVGQVVSFWPVGSQSLVTHRVVELHMLPQLEADPLDPTRSVPLLDDAGDVVENPYIVTKGDANPLRDPNATPLTRVRGVVLAVHEGWGWVLQWAGSARGRATMLVPPLLALATLEIMAVVGARRRRRTAPDRAAEGSQFDDLLLD
ncbi:signal peptidase I [Cellulomonas soli]